MGKGTDNSHMSINSQLFQQMNNSELFQNVREPGENTLFSKNGGEGDGMSDSSDADSENLMSGLGSERRDTTFGSNIYKDPSTIMSKTNERNFKSS